MDRMYGIRLPFGKMYDAAWPTVQRAALHRDTKPRGSTVVVLEWRNGKFEDPVMLPLTENEQRLLFAPDDMLERRSFRFDDVPILGGYKPEEERGVRAWFRKRFKGVTRYKRF